MLKKFDGLTIRIFRSQCIGTMNCGKIAPEVFVLDEEGIVTFAEGVGVAAPERLLEACRVCPVDALSAEDRQGNQLVP